MKRTVALKISGYTAVIVTLFFAGNQIARGEEDMFRMQRERMVERQIKNRGVSDEKVLDAMRTVERHRFVPGSLQDEAYADTPLPIGYGQTISQPYIVAFMMEAAKVGLEDKVLEIGTGCGYQAAVLAELAGEVYTIEILEPLAEGAKRKLKSLGYSNIMVKQGDGYKGIPEHGPYDAIIVTAAPPEIPETLIGQLKPGGRMIVPVGSFYQQLQMITRTEEGYDTESLLPVRFVPMVHGKEGE
ncbi:MAG: protein-L-isoaspartate(D-aspartate) O-methyltransferase [Candidatus Tantalella remota]|nr:protein-L-isoaspartate(D-aspartate) O-methyltransferase [Candidatus Tantalella remota]